jgi:hypothetical protein
MVLADGHRAAGLAQALSTFSTSCLLVAACQGLGYASCLRRAILSSLSPVMPRAWLAYDACLNAGSTAVLAHGHHSETGALTRSCTELIRLPSECIAKNALGAIKLASLTGFAPVISYMRGRHVDWATPQGQKW